MVDCIQSFLFKLKDKMFLNNFKHLISVLFTCLINKRILPVLGRSFLFLFLLLGFSVLTVQAEEGHTAQEISRTSGNIYLQPNGAVTFEIKFKNAGTVSWVNYGENFLELVTAEPILRKSPFEHDFWEKYYLVARMQESTVVPGGTATFRFALKAPTEEGFYLEKFKLVARRKAWVDSDDIALPIYVYKENPFANKNEIKPIAVVKDEEVIMPADNINVPASAKGYAAQLIIKSGDIINVPAGLNKEVKIGFKNIGNKIWKQIGSQFVSIYTVDPNYHVSKFYDSDTWFSDSQIKLDTDKVAPGEIGYFVFKISAPDKVGEYSEEFRLAAEDFTWLYNSKFTLNIKVTQPIAIPYDNQAVIVTINDTQDDNVGSAGNEVAVEGVMTDKPYAGYLMIHSGKSFTIRTGERATFKVGYKNIGRESWQQSGRRFVSLYTVLPNYRKSVFAPNIIEGTTWLNNNQVKIDEPLVAPGVIGYFSLDFQAPDKPGEYIENFRLAAEDYTWVSGGELSLRVIVQDSNDNTSIGSGSAVINDDIKIDEPLLRVGLFRPDKPLEITANGIFSLVDSEDNPLQGFSANEVVVIEYRNLDNLYHISYHDKELTSLNHIKLVPQSPNVILEITNYEKRPTWNTSYNDNRFRGNLELRYNSARNRTWIINEIKMDDYLKGLIETSNYDPIEYLKTMSVAGRTYALYHYNNKIKHEEEFFDVDAYYDQVYRGYTVEERLPNLGIAVDATKGMIVTYDGKAVVTPYYAHSDGRTRSWTSVWGGETKPWLVSVPDPYCQGRTLWGHGVGLSARGAMFMASEDNKTYVEILQYYYKGVDIEKYY